MKQRAATRQRQSGIALLILLTALILAGGYAFYRSANVGFSANTQEMKLIITLARAKEALIAYAVIDDKRPGRMPCPAITEDGSSPLLTRNDCDGWVTGGPDVYSGWLPWKTLDLKEASDEEGLKFRYATTRLFAGDRPSPPLNSETLTSLRLDVSAGTASNDIAAIIIATRGVLDTKNADDDEYYFTGNTKDSDNNDVIATITRQELMAAVEKRVANELKLCLEQHALASANTLHSYPWPAPFSSLDFRGKSGSYFGQLPATQPSAGLNASLQENIAQVQSARNAVDSATQASDQLAAVKQLSETLTQARNLYDALYLAATKLWQNASLTAKSSTTLNADLSKFLKSNTIVNSEQKTIRAEAQTVIDQIDGLYNMLDDSGIDVFPKQLKILSDQYQTQKNITNAQAIQLLLMNSTTTHADIGPALANATGASTAAITTANNLSADPNNPALLTAAENAAITLDTSLNILQASINNSRINRHFSEIAPYSAQIDSLINLLNSAPNAGNAATLAAKLTETKVVLSSIQTGASAILASRNTSLLAIDQALGTAQASIDYPLINASANAVVSSINALVNTMLVNDDNLTRTSLASAINDFKAQQAIFAALNVAATGDRVPYAVSLQNVTVDLKYWANLLVAETDNLARQAKGAPIAAGDDFAKVTPLNTSSYQSAVNALASSQNTASAVQTYINTPTTAKQSAASTALADTLSTAGKLLSNAKALDASLNSSASGALPIIWLSSRCDAFRETADSWWINNQWKNLVFYQISDALRTTAPGRLQVNQTGNYRIVVINAGRSLVGQTRSTRTTANFFEGINADASRDGDAAAAKISFINQPPSANFNDRLAY